MGSTRAVLWAGAVALWTLLPACSKAEAREESGEDRLRIELGGDNPPLRESLRALGVLLEAEPEAEPEPAPRQAGARGPAPGRAEQRRPEPDPLPGTPEPQPRPEPEYFTVGLEKGETLWDLAQEHLGKGTRWNEILVLNGWTEAQARRLPAGTTVRIPRESSR